MWIFLLMTVALYPDIALSHPHSWHYQYSSYSSYTNPKVIDNTGYFYGSYSTYTTPVVVDATTGETLLQKLRSLSQEARFALADALLRGELPDNLSSTIRKSIKDLFENLRSLSQPQRNELARYIYAGDFSDDSASSGLLQSILGRTKGSNSSASGLFDSILNRSNASNSSAPGLLQSILDRSSARNSSTSNNNGNTNTCRTSSAKNGGIFGPIPDTHYCNVLGPVPTHEELFYPNGR